MTATEPAPGLSDPQSSQVVLIGSAEYEHLSPLPSVRENLVGLRDAFADPDLWGLPAANCHLVADAREPGHVGRLVSTAAAAVKPDGMLLVYYAGHGLIDPDDGTLILSLPACEPEQPHLDGLPFDWIRRAVSSSRSRRRVVILDCCYSGRAGHDMSVTLNGTVAVADRAETDGTCLLVSAPANRRASAPRGATYTAFTGEFLRLLRAGQAAAMSTRPAPTLTMEMIWREVKFALTARGFEQPQMRVRNAGGDIPLVRNLAATRAVGAGPAAPVAAPFPSLAGQIIYAAPWFVDEDLGQRAVLVLRHDRTGAVGVCVTRPDAELPADFPESWKSLLTDPAMLFNGGPVARDGYIVLSQLRPGAGTPPVRFTPVRQELGTIALSALPEDLAGVVDAMRVFVGYFGWRAGELEEYLDREALIASRHSPRQVFTSRPGELWQSLQASR